MLKVVQLSQTISENIETDEYIPLKVRWGNCNIAGEPTIYWRTGDLKKSLLEIGIASKTGLIRSLTIVLSDMIFLNGTRFDRQVPIENGTPTFNVNQWLNTNKVDDPGLFEIHYCDSEVNLILSRNEIMKKVVSGRICFGLDCNSSVCLINISRLTEDESIQIKDTLTFMTSQNQR